MKILVLFFPTLVLTLTFGTSPTNTWKIGSTSAFKITTSVIFDICKALVTFCSCEIQLHLFFISLVLAASTVNKVMLWLLNRETIGKAVISKVFQVE